MTLASSAALHQPVRNLVVAAIAQAFCGKEIVKAEPAVLWPCTTKGGHVNVLVNHLDIETGSEKSQAHAQPATKAQEETHPLRVLQYVNCPFVSGYRWRNVSTSPALEVAADVEAKERLRERGGGTG